MQWQSDPELKNLRDEFIVSLQSRSGALVEQIVILENSGAAFTPTHSGAAFAVRVVAHNLAGAAGSYGFPELGRIATLLDDFLSLSKQEIRLDILVRFTKILITSLHEARSLGDDCRAPKSAAYNELTSCVESLGVAASS